MPSRGSDFSWRPSGGADKGTDLLKVAKRVSQFDFELTCRRIAKDYDGA